MSVLEAKVLPAPIGHATSMEESGTPENLARLLRGVWPARLGVQRMRPVPRKLAQIIPVHAGEQIQGYAIYRCQQLSELVADLLVFTDRNLYVIPLYSKDPALGSGTIYAYVQYDQKRRGQTLRLNLGPTAATSYQHAPTSMGTSDWPAAGFAAGTLNNVASVQFGNELLFTVQGSTSTNNWWRYYRDSVAQQYLYGCYIPAGGAPTIVSHTTTRDPINKLNGGPYQYAWTWVDEQGRESSPSDSVSITGLANEEVVVGRGTTTTGTDTAPLAGWNLYRRNPGNATSYNLLNTSPMAVATTTYLDRNADTAITGNAVMPGSGANDPPDNATFMAIHKSRVAANSLYNFGVVQLSNAASATQFSSITVPTDTSGGVKLSIGDDAEHVVTGIESIGDMLWIAKPSSYYLLQGNSISDWDLQQVGKNRGCDNSFSVQRTEDLILFKSSDGVYGLSYQAGMVSPKMSWQIDDLLNGFGSPLTPNERQPYGGVFTPSTSFLTNDTTGQPVYTPIMARYIDFARSFYWQQRYFLCLPSGTLLFDGLTKEWADSGLGPLKWPVTYSGIQDYNITGLPSGGLPDMVVFSYGGAYSGDLDVYWFASSDTPYDDEMVTTYGPAYEVTEDSHDFDASGDPMAGSIRGVRLTIYGETGKRRGERLGSAQFMCGNRKVGRPIPLRAHSVIDRQDALVQVGCPVGFKGQQLWVTLRWNTPDIVLGKRLLEYIRSS